MTGERAAPRLTPRPPDEGPPSWAADPEGLLKSGPESVKAALTGGVASGKSTVAALLEAFGAARLDFDVFVRGLSEPGGACFEQIQSLFGPKATGRDGRLDRVYIRDLAFKNREMRKALEDVLHPASWSVMLAELGALGPLPLIVVEVPLLFEARLDSLFDPVILSFASPERQVKRLMDRDESLGRRKAKRIVETQTPILEKLRRAGIVVDNNGPMSQVVAQTKKVWTMLTAGAPVSRG
ncbi:MAG: dephospho-CoA kinase [Deltaproteobacteria bacterium]|jgi:dephospho-CoA kinase|nr:dephospho-CoA kinase [Deltaproteobacteria bacterium]